jgi:hypothetical protein
MHIAQTTSVVATRMNAVRLPVMEEEDYWVKEWFMVDNM